MDAPDTAIIQCSVGQVAEQLARLGLDPTRVVTIMIEPEDWLTQAHRRFHAKPEASGLDDQAIDALIKEARREANQEMRRAGPGGPDGCASS